MSHVIDARGAGGELVVIGKAIVLPNSEAPVLPGTEPLVGALRYNPAGIPRSETGVTVSGGTIEIFLPHMTEPGVYAWNEIGVTREDHHVMYSDGATMDGRLKMVGAQILLDDGASSVPGLAFVNAPTTGLYRDDDTSTLRTAVLGVNIITVSPSEVDILGLLTAVNANIAQTVTADTGKFNNVYANYGDIVTLDNHQLTSDIGFIGHLTSNLIDVVPAAGADPNAEPEIVLIAAGTEWIIAHDPFQHYFTVSYQGQVVLTLTPDNTLRSDNIVATNMKSDDVQANTVEAAESVSSTDILASNSVTTNHLIANTDVRTQHVTATVDVVTVDARASNSMVTNHLVANSDVVTTDARATNSVTTNHLTANSDVTTTDVRASNSVVTNHLIANTDILTTDLVSSNSVTTNHLIANSDVTTKDIRASNSVSTQNMQAQSVSSSSMSTTDFIAANSVTTRYLTANTSVTTPSVATTDLVATNSVTTNHLTANSDVQTAALTATNTVQTAALTATATVQTAALTATNTVQTKALTATDSVTTNHLIANSDVVTPLVKATDVTASNAVITASLFATTISAPTILGTNITASNAMGSYTLTVGKGSLAETYLADTGYPVGTVMVIGGAQEVTQSTSNADARHVGVVADSPGITLAQVYNAYTSAGGNGPGTPVFLTVAGRTLCRVVNAVAVGDLLITSDTPGCAQTAPNTLWGADIIGRALASYAGGTDGNGNPIPGTILIKVS